jgi:hypothetical protein
MLEDQMQSSSVLPVLYDRYNETLTSLFKNIYTFKYDLEALKNKEQTFPKYWVD